MIKLLAVSAALLTLAIAGSHDARAWCDEDCAEEMHEAAQEAAYERASAREEAEEYGGSRYSSTRREDPRSARGQMNQERAARAESNRSAKQKRIAEPRSEPESTPAPATQIEQPIGKVATENSSITTASTRIADDDSYGRPAAQRDVGCKTFFPATGMTLSVPCD